MRIMARLACLVLLSACALPAGVPERRTMAIADLPAMKTFPPGRATPPQRSNAGIARDILALEFQMESGRDLPRLTRFSGPITIALTGDVPPTAATDLSRLLDRLRAEAGIDVTPVAAGPASITVEFLPRRRLQAVVPQAACFVVPRVSNWSEYRRARRTDRVDWTRLTTRDQVAVFIPSDTAPQEIRDCLHEEVAQALGPLNDLFELSDSVFNDDNFHTVLTGFDMLVLKVHYAPELANGMDRAAVAARLPAVLSRLNPGGGPGTPLPPTPTPRPWIEAMETALGPKGTPDQRRSAARQALQIARSQGWADSRLGFSFFAVGRLSLAEDADAAVGALADAARIYRTLPDADIHVAHIDVQMAALALSAGQPADAIKLANRAMPAVTRSQNAALLASLLMIKAEALEMTGNPVQAQALRLDSFGWARYGFGTEDEVRRHLTEFAVLSPLQGG
ncbi:MAG: DUF2927 domain-containing protein [Rhodobacter sp.]|nr:DUF2927 domain-containing protein [Rhodobacter sp.]MCA3492187.1 DUF2927 domain-containing protein [Rhodobacter sp.]MCA3500399.1 DUF2927 domain-containing protein [Rhodobacter sp.]MCA3502299.1 DUF2927 domain-containing protein [Rhodobacter sp.]MCA3515662.1 DUF2927 domain-containing protein [Rhodobacter sp.]